MTDRDAPIRRYADLFRKPEPPLTLEMVEKALRTMMAQGWLVPNLHTDEDGIIERLRQQMGGGQG